MITFDSPDAWQAWLDGAFPVGARVEAQADPDTWDVTPRLMVTDFDGEGVQISCAPWSYMREIITKVTGFEEIFDPTQKYPRFRGVTVKGYAPLAFSLDIASADPEEMARQRKEWYAENRWQT